MEPFLEKHSGELMILVLCLFVLSTLLVDRAPAVAFQPSHAGASTRGAHEGPGAGPAVAERDTRSVAAGRTAVLVPMVVMCAAATVTCFLSAYKTDSFFGIALTVWAVAGVVSLAAITGGVALMGRLAQLRPDEAGGRIVDGEVSSSK